MSGKNGHASHQHRLYRSLDYDIHTMHTTPGKDILYAHSKSGTFTRLVLVMAHAKNGISTARLILNAENRKYPTIDNIRSEVQL
jgi:hypothetical protein